MIYVGIDVAKDKHDCCILGPDTEELFQVFTIRNNSDGYGELFHKIESVSKDKSQIKIGLEVPVTIPTTFWDHFLTMATTPLSSIRYIQIFTEKVKALERRKRIKSMPAPLLKCL